MLDEAAHVWNTYQHASPVERARIAQAWSNRLATFHFADMRRHPAWRRYPPMRVPALSGALLLMMVKDEEGIIGQNLRHHYALGFRRYFILDNGSTDRTAAIITSFRLEHTDAEVFYAFDFVVGYYQSDKMNALQSFARSYLKYEERKPEWAFFVDADEFLTFCGFEDPDRSTARFNSILEDDRNSLIITHWVQCSSRSVLAHVATEADILAEFSETWKRLKVPVTKVAFRLQGDFRIEPGNHMVRAISGDLQSIVHLCQHGYYTLHFPIRSIKQLSRKLDNGLRALGNTNAAANLAGYCSHWTDMDVASKERGGDAIQDLVVNFINDTISA